MVVISPTGTLTAGQTYSLDCSVSGTTDPVTYQWFEGPSNNQTSLTSDTSRTIIVLEVLYQLHCLCQST